MAGYDTDPIGALGVALRRALDAAPDATWNDLLAAAPLDPSTREALRQGDVAALDALATRLNEDRALR